MALIKCPECGTEVSDSAAQCVKCGYSLKQPAAPTAAAPVAPTAAASAAPTAAASVSPPAAKPKKSVVGLIILIIVIALAVPSMLVIGVLVADPRFNEASAKAKANEAPRIISSFESAFLAALADGMPSSKIGTDDLIIKLPSPDESRYWKYDLVMPGGKIIATSKVKMSGAGAGSVITSEYNAAGDCFVHTADPQLARLIPNFTNSCDK